MGLFKSASHELANNISVSLNKGEKVLSDVTSGVNDERLAALLATDKDEA